MRTTHSRNFIGITLSLWLGAWLSLGSASRILAQQSLLGAITGSVMDTSGAAVPGAKITAHNVATNLEQTATSGADGSYQIPDLPIGAYKLTIALDGFQTEEHTQILVQGGHTTTVNGSLKPGTISTTVQVTATPLLNQVDTTNGYILDSLTIQNTPLGTGSFTQLAILAPGVNADLLAGAGSNSGLGNQAIFANGQRDSSNSFSINGVSSNNLFNGNSTSQVSSNRYVLNTNENFLPDGTIVTNTSVYDAIGQGLPTPPPETIEELRVNTSMYDASQGAHSGAQIELTTKSGTNEFHGMGYGYYQTSDWNAAPFFRNASPAIPADQKVPYLDNTRYGATLGGPVVKNKLFFFGSYQGTRIHDATLGQSFLDVPQGLTNDRSAAALANLINNDFGTSAVASQMDPIALKLMQAKTSNGQYLIPTPTITDPNVAAQLGYNALITVPAPLYTVTQINGNMDYVVSSNDRISGKYFYQNNPNSSPFAASQTLGFPQTLFAGAQAFSLDNSRILTPNLTWDLHAGFTRQRAFAGVTPQYTAQDFGINLFGLNKFPGINIQYADPNVGNSLSIGPASNFANAGVYQNQFEYGTGLGWVVGKHTIKAGTTFDLTQLNIVNENNQVASIGFADFSTFMLGQVRPGLGNSVYFTGSSNRYYRATTAGAYVTDNWRLKSNLTLDLGVRYDYDGPLWEKYGNLTNFYPNQYAYSESTDAITASGLVIAGNNPTVGTRGVSPSTMLANQWGFAPRLGVVWSPSAVKNVVVRAGWGMYYDRGEFFSELSPSAGFGYNGPFGVTLEPPFVVPFAAPQGATFENPFGTTPPPAPPGTVASFAGLLPNKAGLINGANPFLFGGYDPYNNLPFTQNWTLDLQWQPLNDWVFDLAYVGNHGTNLTVPVPFNQAQIATPQHPVHGEQYSYGYNVTTLEPYSTADGGNTDLRVPYLGYSPNSVYYEAAGISNYNALQFQVRKRFSRNFMINASYTWSHSLDDQSGLGLFYNGNNPLNLSQAYGNSDFDRTHVFTINYLYNTPKVTNNRALGTVVNGWGLSGTTVAESGQPYGVYDFSGAVASLYYSNNDYITNPFVPIASGFNAGSAQLQGTMGVNPNNPVLNYKAFYVPTVAPGTNGVPPCGVDFNGNPACDTYETAFGSAGRNMFRGPFQTRFDLAAFKEFSLTERFRLRYEADFFNLFNQPSFDTPNNNVQFYSFGNPPRTYNPPHGSLGYIQHTIGSPRFIQMSLHLTF